ncbi:Uncharacterised protein [Sphingobacterium daejeonense]|nr:Uncharacterised protein [Sphingobacterium daejeonense]
MKTLKSGVNAVHMYNIDTKQSQQVTDGMSEVQRPILQEMENILFLMRVSDVGLTNSGLHMNRLRQKIAILYLCLYFVQ